MGPYVTNYLKNANRNFLMTHLFLLFATLGVALLSNRYLENFVFGPYPYRPAEAAKGDASTFRKYYVRVAGDKSVDTGMTEVTQRKRKYSDEVLDESVSARFVLLRVEGKILLVKSDGDGKEQTEYIGSLVPLPTEVHDRLLSDIPAEQSATFQSALLPYMLDTSNFNIPGYIGMAIGIPVLLFSCWNVSLFTRRQQDPKTHPTMQELARHGEVTTVAWELDAEMKGTVLAYGNCKFTPNWLVREGSYNLMLMRRDDLVWAYQKVTQHRTNGIPTGKSYAAILWDCHGRTIEVSGSEEKLKELLQQLAVRTPWMVLGFDASLETLWRQDRANFVQQVNQRRQSLAWRSPNPPVA